MLRRIRFDSSVACPSKLLTILRFFDVLGAALRFRVPAYEAGGGDSYRSKASGILRVDAQGGKVRWLLGGGLRFHIVDVLEALDASSSDAVEADDKASIACVIALDLTELVKSSGTQSPGSRKNNDGLAKGSNNPDGDGKRTGILSLR
jgi:hypothetical protein